MIAVYYNPKKDIYYAKFLRNAYFSNYYRVGYVNQYGHKIVCMFYINKNKFISCNSFWDYLHNRKSLKKKIIKNIISWLERRV